MRLQTYRLIVIGSMVSSFLVGLHVPALHNMIEHGATPRWEVVAATLVLAIGSVAGSWMLLRTPGG
ncbi:MAG TPA: hypothetical protein VMO26_21245 [Vicinamibacterales bacterium]|nr:hypothetical protein [Vicinamibacterales bacterium]